MHMHASCTTPCNVCMSTLLMQYVTGMHTRGTHVDDSTPLGACTCGHMCAIGHVVMYHCNNGHVYAYCDHCAHMDICIQCHIHAYHGYACILCIVCMCVCICTLVHAQVYVHHISPCNMPCAILWTIHALMYAILYIVPLVPTGHNPGMCIAHWLCKMAKCGMSYTACACHI